MSCPACGADNPPGSRFCNGCGAPLAAVCPACNQTNPPTSRFCNACGRPLAEAGPEAAAITAPPPTSYTPRHLAEKILAGRDALAGERKQVTVLFADVVGSTELIRDRDPEDAQRLLDGAVERMMAAVHRYEGTVSRLMGDGLMAMFGAPVAHEDHAVRTCFAALAMLEAARAYADEVRRVHRASIQIRVGLNSGEVVVRLISDDLHMDYTAMGQTVHLASRMEGLASAGTCLLSPSTLALAEGFVEVRPLGPRSVRGLDDPTEVYELTGVGAARTRLQVSAARGLTPFVGRDAEWAAIDGALARARAGQGQVVALVAEPGVGKSRLVWEAARSDRAAGSTVLHTGAVSYGQATAWLAVIDLLRSYFQIESRDDHAAMREKVTTGVSALDPALAPGVPALLDVPVEDAAWVSLDPAQRRRATLDAVRQLLLRESQKRPLLLVFEDLHWIDSETQALLDSLVEALPTSRILLLVNFRPEYTHSWGNRSYYTQIRIEPLGEQSAEALLDALLGPDRSLQPLTALLIRRTEGTPLFLEESVRALVETGALVGERGAYRLTRPVEEIRVPATVQAVLAARIDRLPPEEKRLLQTAAVIGKDVAHPLLQAIAEMPADALQAALSRLQAAELLYAVSLFPEPEYTFKHALTHDVAYGSLLQERRRALHAQIVAVTEAMHAGRLAEHVERLAYHAVQAQLWPQAEAYCAQAGARAMARYAYREAATWQEQALQALSHLPEDRAVLERSIDLRVALRNSLQPIGEIHRVLQHLTAAEVLAERLGDQGRLGAIWTSMTNVYWVLGEHDRSVERGEQAVAVTEAQGDVLVQIGARFVLSNSYWGRGEYRRALACTMENLAVIESRALRDDDLASIPGTSTHPAVGNRANSAWYLAELGEFDRAVVLGEAGVRVAEDLRHAYSLTLALFHLGSVYLRRGDVVRAIRSLERAVELARVREFRFYVPFAVFRLGAAYTLAGRAADGLPLLEEGLEDAKRSSSLADLPRCVVWLAEAYLALGQVTEASAVAQRAVDMATAQGERANLAWAYRVLGEIAARRDPPDSTSVEAQYRQALALAEELEMRPLQARCHLGLGTLYRRLGRADVARVELSPAATMLREMGMTFWLPEAEAELEAARTAPVD